MRGRLPGKRGSGLAGGPAGGPAGKCGSLGALALDSGQQSLFRGGCVAAHQVDVDYRGQQPLKLAGAHAYGEERPLFARRVLGERRGPLRLSIESRQVIGREHRDSSRRLDGGALHIKDEVRPRAEIPGLYDYALAGGFQLPGDPLRPG
jgi:hypothetical protein